MTNEQKSEFEQRRLKVVRRHVENDPKIRALRRKHKRRIVTSVIGSVVALFMAMVFIKGFVLAVHGPQDYARIVAPMLDGASAGSLSARLLGPDPVTREIAAILQPILPRGTELANTGAADTGLAETMAVSDAEPEL